MSLCDACRNPVETGWHYCQACGHDLTKTHRNRPISATLIAILLAAGLLVGAVGGAVWASRAPEGDGGSFATVFASAGDGIVRVETLSCGGSGIGSGFLISPSMVMTSAHVVKDAVSVAISTEHETAAASVTGIDLEADLAVLTLDRSIVGHIFTFRESLPTPGLEVVALGYPLGSPLSLSMGTVSGVGRLIEGFGEVSLLQTDTAVNQGNSGGPLIDRAGEVVGVVVASRVDGVGLGYAVEAVEASRRAARWSSEPRTLPSPTCSEPLGPDQEVIISSTEPERDPMVIDVFTAYFGGINRADFPLAWGQLGATVQASTSLTEFVASTSKTYNFAVSVKEYEILDSDTHQLWITFSSLQDPEEGADKLACAKWSVEYTVHRAEGRWKIVDAKPHDGPLNVPC